MQVYFFDYFQITERLALYKYPFKLCDGCAVIKEEQLFIYFYTYQNSLLGAIEHIENKLSLKCHKHSYCLGELFEFLR